MSNMLKFKSDSLCQFDAFGFTQDEQTQLDDAKRNIFFLLKNESHNLFLIGNELARVRDLYAKRGAKGEGFKQWCEEEFAMSRKSAYRFIQIYETFSQYEAGITLTQMMGKSALYLVTSGTTPKAARAEIIQRIARSEKITHEIALEIVNRHKNKHKRLSPIQLFEKIRLALSQWEARRERAQKNLDATPADIDPEAHERYAREVADANTSIKCLQFVIALFASLKKGQDIPLINGELAEFGIEIEEMPERWGEFDIEIESLNNLVSN